MLAGGVLALGSATFSGAEAQMMAQDLPEDAGGEQPFGRTKLIEEGDCLKGKPGGGAPIVYLELAVYLYGGQGGREEDYVVFSSLHKFDSSEGDPVPVSEAPLKDPPPGGFKGQQLTMGALDNSFLPGISTAVSQMCNGERSIWHIPASRIKGSTMAKLAPLEEGFKVELLLVKHHDFDKIGF